MEYNGTRYSSISIYFKVFTFSSTNPRANIAFAGGNFFVLGATDYILASNDGENWQEASLQNIVNVCFISYQGSPTFVAFEEEFEPGKQTFLVSENGFSWMEAGEIEGQTQFEFIASFGDNFPIVAATIDSSIFLMSS